MSYARARRRRIELGYEPCPVPVSPPRSPQEVELEQHAEIAAQAFIDARIDFLYNVGEDAARKHTRHLLESSK